MSIPRFLVFLFATSCAFAQEVKINPGRYERFYHVAFDINARNSRLDQKCGFTQHGQFQVYIKRQLFPIPAPGRGGKILLRMPATLSVNQEQEKIQAKREIYDKIRTVLGTKQGAVKVIIELNPYVKTIQKKPLKLELENCNVFFRQANDGAYKDTL